MFNMDFLFSIIKNKFFIVAIEILLFILFLKIVNIIIDRFSERVKKYNDDLEFIKQVNTIKLIIKSIVDTIIIGFAVMYIFNRLGIDIRPILTAAGIVGVAVGFGSKRFVEDVITGLGLILEGQLRVGDVVEIAGKLGTVEKLDIKLVVLRDISGNVHYIRNGMIDIVTNMTRDYSYYMFNIGVAYNENLDKVFQVLKEADAAFRELEEFKNDIYEPLEILGVDELSDSAVIIKARYKTRPRFQWGIGRGFNKFYKERFDAAGIEIPFPQCTVHLQNQDS